MEMVSVTTFELRPHPSVAVYERLKVPENPHVVFDELENVVVTDAGVQASVTDKDCGGGSGWPHSIVREGMAIAATGAVVSLTAMYCTADADKPQLSTTTQVRVMLVMHAETMLTESVEKTVTLGEQVSPPCAAPRTVGLVDAPHSIVSDEGAMMVGGVVSTLDVVKDCCAELPHWSVAVTV